MHHLALLLARFQTRICIRQLALALLPVLLLALAPSAMAQGGPRPAPTNIQRELQRLDGYDIEIANGRTGRLEIGPTNAIGVSGLSGNVFGDPISGRREPTPPRTTARPLQLPDSGGMSWVSYRNGRPFEAYQARYDGASGYWVGAVHALDAASDLATPARSVWAFRARLSLRTTRPGIAPLGRAPTLTNPPVAAQPFSFGQPVLRTYPIMVGDDRRGWLRVRITANGEASGVVSDGAGAPIDQLAGFYAGNAGTLSLARVTQNSTAVSEVFTALLWSGQELSGELVRINADQTPPQRSWSVGPSFQFANQRHNGCLTFQDDSTAPGAQAWLNKASNSDNLLPCANAGASRRWGFIETGAGQFEMVNLHSGLCLTPPSERNGPYTQEACANEAGSTPAAARASIDAVTNPEVLTSNQFMFEEIHEWTRLAEFRLFWIHTGAYCPGSFNNTLPMVLDVCDGSRGPHYNDRGLWRFD